MISFIGRGGNVVAASDNWVGSLAGLTLQAGDLLIANIAYRDSVPFTVPAGWTLVAQESQGNTSATNTTAIASGIMAYIIRGEENPDLTFTRTGGSVAQGRVQAFRGVDPANPFIGGVSATMAANGTIVQTSDSLVTTRENALIVIGACNAVNGSSVAADMKALTDPTTGWTERCDDSSAVSPTTQQAFGDAIKASAGDTGVLQWRNSATTRAVIIAAAFNPPPEPVTRPTGGGKGKSRRREIVAKDGRRFYADTDEDLRRIAEQLIAERVEEAPVKKKISKKIRKRVKPVERLATFQAWDALYMRLNELTQQAITEQLLFEVMKAAITAQRDRDEDDDIAFLLSI